MIVCKNSGGNATFAKIEAARNLGLPVIMIERPGAEPVTQATSREVILKSVQKFLEQF